MKHVHLVFPHQLFEESELIEKPGHFYLIEEALFFNQYKFHKAKLVFHRATMKYYETFLLENNQKVNYIQADDSLSDIRKFVSELPASVEEITCYYPHDNWLQQRLEKSCEKRSIQLTYLLTTPMFLNQEIWKQDFFKSSKQKYHQTTFYKQQRKQRSILLNENGQPTGGKWTFDQENRKSWPKGKVPPAIYYPKENHFVSEAREYVMKNYSQNPGELTADWLYPVTYEQSRTWLQQFFEFRFHEFGDYEDAIVEQEHILNHSVLSPMLNIGLLTPDYIIQESIRYANANNIPINSLEGFIRQIIGWREFIYGIYEVKGSRERTTNFWNFTKSLPASFYDAATGIPPVDQTIKKVLKTGYCHHIERLMILSNFMLLCEIHPDEVYQWFMELFIDAYDWVMVPNVYGMSQFADGGLMSTKPYISSSNYIQKMSNYSGGEWVEIWDALFWRFMHVHRDFFEQNPRMRMLLSNWDKKDKNEQNKVLKTAEEYLSDLSE